MYEQASLKIASACQILEGSVASANPLGTGFEGRSAFHQLLDSARVFWATNAGWQNGSARLE